MNKLIFGQYAKLEQKKRLIEEQQIALREKLLEEMEKEDFDRVESSFGTFAIAVRKLWKYSGKVVELEARLKDRKKEEEAKGIATFEGRKELKFYVKRDEKPK